MDISRTSRAVLRAYWTHGYSKEPIAAAPIHVTRIEVQFVREVRVVRVDRTRPVEAVSACAVERTVVAAACRGKENTIAIALAGHFDTIHTILSSPFPRAFLKNHVFSKRGN